MRIKSTQVFKIDPDLRAKKRSAYKGVDLLAQTLVGINLIAAYFDTGNACQRSLDDFESDNQVQTIQRYALQYLYVRVPIAKVSHVIPNRALILLEQSNARVAAPIAEIGNESERVRLL